MPPAGGISALLAAARHLRDDDLDGRTVRHALRRYRLSVRPERAVEGVQYLRSLRQILNHARRPVADHAPIIGMAHVL